MMASPAVAQLALGRVERARGVRRLDAEGRGGAALVLHLDQEDRPAILEQLGLCFMRKVSRLRYRLFTGLNIELSSSRCARGALATHLDA